MLRFQGAYSKDLDLGLAAMAQPAGDWKDGGRFRYRHERRIAELMYGCNQSLEIISQTRFSAANDLGFDTFPKSNWGGYMSVWGHAIGIGSRGDSYYIMEPNAGLFCYIDANSFVAFCSFLSDLNDLITARRASWLRKHRKYRCACGNIERGKDINFCSECGQGNLTLIPRIPPAQPLTIFRTKAGAQPGVPVPAGRGS